MNDSKIFLSSHAAAEFLGVTVGTLSVWRCLNRYSLPYIKVGRRIHYRMSDLIEFIDRRTFNKKNIEASADHLGLTTKQLKKIKEEERILNEELNS